MLKIKCENRSPVPKISARSDRGLTVVTKLLIDSAQDNNDIHYAYALWKVRNSPHKLNNSTKMILHHANVDGAHHGYVDKALNTMHKNVDVYECQVVLLMSCCFQRPV